MLSRFFGNSKPIVLVSLLCIISLWYWMFVFFGTKNNLNLSNMQLISNWLILLFIVLTTDFINKKSKISKQNSYTLISLVSLSLSTPEVFFSKNSLLTALFFILTIRRIINLQNPIKTKKKIFEASFWLFFATLIEPGLAFGYLIIYFAILFFASQNYKNFLIPLFGPLAGYILLQLYYIIRQKNWFLFPADFFSFGIDFKPSINHIQLLIIYGLFALIIAINHKKILKKAKVSKKTNLGILTAFMLLAMVNAGYTAQLVEEELILVFIPFSFLLGNYFQLKQRKILKESIFGLLLILPFLKIILLLV